MALFDSIRGIVLGLILTAIGWIMIDSKLEIELLVHVGWIFFLGGIAVVGLSIFSTVVKR